jgi:hypothetical protein
MTRPANERGMHRDYRDVLRARGRRWQPIQRTEKKPGELEFNHAGELVEVRCG